MWCPFLSMESPWISVPIPPLNQFRVSEFRNDDFHHQLKASHRLAIGDLTMQRLHPRPKAVHQSRSPQDHSLDDMPHLLGKVARRYTPCKTAAEDKKIKPEKPAIPHHHERKNGEGAFWTVRVEAEVPWNPHRNGHCAVGRMKPLAQVGAVLAASRKMASRTRDRVICSSCITIGYFHSGGRFVPFLLLRKCWQEEIN